LKARYFEGLGKVLPDVVMSLGSQFGPPLGLIRGSICFGREGLLCSGMNSVTIIYHAFHHLILHLLVDVTAQVMPRRQHRRCFVHFYERPLEQAGPEPKPGLSLTARYASALTAFNLVYLVHNVRAVMLSFGCVPVACVQSRKPR
jgi:hypothetical protein